MFGFLHKGSANASIQLGVVSLFASAALASLDAVWSIFIDSFVQNASVTGSISAAATALYFFAYLFSGPILERYNEKKTWIFSAAIMALGYIGYMLANNLVAVLLIACIVIFGNVFRTQAQSIMVRDNVGEVDISEAEGIQYAMRNVGWLLAPLLAGFVAETLGVQIVFLIAAILIILGALHLRNLPIIEVEHDAPSRYKNLASNIKTFFTDKQRRISYVVNGGVGFWWGFVYTYVPLYILSQGLATFWVGVFLSAMVIPLVVLEYPIGKLTSRYGHRPFLLSGYIILAVCAFFASLASNVFITLGFLAFASVGAAMLEGTRESFYFAITTQKEEKRYLGTWMTSRTLCSTLAKLLVAAILVTFSYNVAFALVGVCLLFAAGVSLGAEK